MRVGSLVLSICSLDEDGIEVCRPGDRGRVEFLEDTVGAWPLVRFERTGCASIVDPDTEVVQTRHARIESA